MAGLARLGVPPLTRLAVETAAAGGHHLCVTGPPGSAIPALAAGLTALLPPLDPGEATEVNAVHSVAGLLASGQPLITRPPLRSPHHTVTPAALAGGGPGNTRPGEAALAHRGVLFLQDAPEFAAGALRVLRQPLTYGEITVARGGSTVVFPARFILMAGMAPCPCGAWPGCECTPLRARRYRARFAGELGSYIAIWLQAAPPDPAEPGGVEPGSDAGCRFGGAGRRCPRARPLPAGRHTVAGQRRYPRRTAEPLLSAYGRGAGPDQPCRGPRGDQPAGRASGDQGGLDPGRPGRRGPARGARVRSGAGVPAGGGPVTRRGRQSLGVPARSCLIQFSWAGCCVASGYRRSGDARRLR